MPTLPKRSFVFLVRLPILALILILLGMGTFSRRGFLDWKRMRNRNEEVTEKMLVVSEQKAALEKQIQSFEFEKVEQERVVRQVLGYIRANETVIEFE